MGRTTDSSRTTGNSHSGTNTRDSSGTDTGTGRSSRTGTASDDDDNKSSSAKDTGVYVGVTTSIDPRLPAGTISLKTPGATESTYIKIGQLATFEWDYVSVSVTPRHLNIQAICSHNSETYTLATSHAARETQWVWDTEEFQANATVPLLTSKYTLQVYDSEQNMTVVAKAGYLAPFSQTFAMYSPKAPTPLAEYNCVGCKNGAAPAYKDPTVLKWCAAMMALFVASTLQSLYA